MRNIVTLFATIAVIIAASWWQLGRPNEIPPAAADPGRIQCVSYAPFAADQSPLDENVHVEARQIEDDLTRLAKFTGCVRTYSSAQGIDQVPPIAARLGLKVIQGLWLGRDRQKNRAEIDRTIALAKRYHDAITAIVVGNEVLLRAELAAADIAAILREVKTEAALPVTYADVWEFWLRNRELVGDVDFVTIHILPYWEDFPIAADMAAAHVEAIRNAVAAAFPGKDILIGEVGWPSAGRMREGALPSPSNQARVLEEVMTRAREKNFRVNLIEAVDQPWKRQLEGTVGGYWGLLTARGREPKFAWAEPVSDHPWWRWQLAGGIALAAAIFAVAGAGWRRRLGAAKTDPAKTDPAATQAMRPETATPEAAAEVPARILAGLGLGALAAGVSAPWAVENAAIESLGPGGFIHGAAFIALAFAAPVAAMAALAEGIAVPSFAGILGRPKGRPKGRPHGGIALASGFALVATTILALQAALGLVFDPRYRDFAFAPLTAAVVPIAATVALSRRAGRRGPAETVAAATLAASAVYIALNESFTNWQALWFSALLLLLAVTLFRLRDVPGT